MSASLLGQLQLANISKKGNTVTEVYDFIDKLLKTCQYESKFYSGLKSLRFHYGTLRPSTTLLLDDLYAEQFFKKKRELVSLFNSIESTLSDQECKILDTLRDNLAIEEQEYLNEGFGPGIRRLFSPPD